MNEKKRNSFGVIAFIINILIFFINIFMFLPMLVEQIKIGKSTKNELAALSIWLIDIMIIVPLLVALVLTIISTAKRDHKLRIISNFF